MSIYKDIARKIQEVWTAQGKLPHNYLNSLYHEISVSYKNARSTDEDFASFYYTNEWKTGNIEDNYAHFFGPCIELKAVIKDVWHELSPDEQTQLMALVLGKNE